MIKDSRKILKKSIEEFNPDFICMMVSGGNDSACAFHVAKELGIKIDFVVHIITGTGIQQTTDFVRETYGDGDIPYIEADAGDAYEKYVIRKGFFGRGMTAHSYAYHILKAQPLRKVISKHIRKRRRNITVMLLNGARIEESSNRKSNMTEWFKKDPAQKGNIWVNLIHNWTKYDRDKFLQEKNVPMNPVSKAMCRSG